MIDGGSIKAIGENRVQNTKKTDIFASGMQNALVAIFTGVFQIGNFIEANSLAYPGMKSTVVPFGIKLISKCVEKWGNGRKRNLACSKGF